MTVDHAKINAALAAATRDLLGAGLTGEEYLLALQTLTAAALAVNAPSVKRIFLLNLSADVRARRLAALREGTA